VTTVTSKRKLRVHLPVFLALVAVALLLAAINLWGPMATARRQQEELVRLRAEKVGQQEEGRQLRGYKRKLASDEGQESAARRSGYVREGDRRLVFVKEKAKGRGREGQ